MPVFVFDTGPLSHFARAQRLDALKTILAGHTAVIPKVVVDELKQGLHLHKELTSVIEADWIEHRQIQTDAEVEVFSKYVARLVSSGRNVGEAAVLALAETIGATAVIDDAVAHRIARQSGVSCKRTLALFVEAASLGVIQFSEVSELVDRLNATDYRLPVGPGEFARWAIEENLFAT